VNHYLRISILLLLGGIGIAQDIPKIKIARWPADRLAAISLTFDDALNTHLDSVYF
jgi:hypothetical protein